MRILVTGGAGFIGSHLVDALVERGDDVVVLDALVPAVHPSGEWPAYANARAECIRGDVTDRAAVARALDGVEAVVHNAAAVGIAQSQYEIASFSTTNIVGTANLFDVLVRERRSVRKIIVPSSMSAYGEGLYRCERHGPQRPGLRRREELAAGIWEPRCAACGAVLGAIPTPESAPFDHYSVYSLTKATQEEMALLLGRLYGIPTVAFRYFNVYGPRQSVSNPYTGVTAIFLSRLKNGNAPVVYEDGRQTRDFVSVHDVVRANLLALDSHAGDGGVFNIGTGVPTSVLDVARVSAMLLGVEIEPQVGAQYRLNDIRHCFADTTLARETLRFEPRVGFEEGMRDLVRWAAAEEAVDRFDVAAAELARAGLVGR